MEKVLGYIGDGSGTRVANVVIGGERVLKETGGYFVAPTIFDNVRRDMRVAREEIFGPCHLRHPVQGRGRSGGGSPTTRIMG